MKLVDVKAVLISLLGVALVHGSAYSMNSEGAVELIVPGDTWRFFRGTVPPSDPPDAWKETDFNDLGWETGASGFGYGDNDDATKLLDMQGSYLTVYIRKEFVVSSVDPYTLVELVIDYDDGFVAYLNGDEVKRKHMPGGTPTYTTTASSHEAGTPETFVLGTAADLLNDGNNVLAIEGHNASYGSSDFSLIPALRTVSNIVLTEDTTWSGAQILEDTVIVPAGIVLNIEPGTVVQMKTGVSIKVYGQLLADGTEAEPIRFTHYGAGTTWQRIMFIEAADSRLVHCIIEYADSEGAHQDYYVPGPRDYHEAIVVLASHLDVEGCIFQNLPDDSANAEGDALAIISDDPCHPGDATAHIRGSQFLSIGQGVHTRFSYILVEDCFFTGKHGDNDDVDLWGEPASGGPPPLIRNNLFLNPGHDDMINPTKCSAVIIGNIIAGSDDHGVVLRDKSSPVMINNLIYNCRNAGIAVENTCDALLINNTIAHITNGPGIKLFDLGRAGSPYYLTKGGGVATLINCIVWDCQTSIRVTDSHQLDGEPNAGSHVTVKYSNIEGGRIGVSIIQDGAVLDSTVTWLEANINIDPQFVDPGSGDHHLKSQPGRWNPNTQSWVQDGVTSPCIDKGDLNSDWTLELWPHGKRINIGAYGGTPQASMSPSTVGNIADLNTNDSVNFRDYARFAGSWQIQQVLLPEDFDRNGKVDFKDAAIFAINWLWQQ